MRESSAWERAAERLNVSNKPCLPGKRNKHAGASASTCADNFSEQFSVLCTGLFWQLSALICRRRRGDWGDEALENDELEGRQGLGARVIHRIKEFRRLGVSIEGTLFTLVGPAEGLAGTRDGEGGDQEETGEEHRVGMGHRPTVPGCAGRTGQLKEGTAASVEQAGRPGQLACPEDMLEQRCRLPKAIWLTRTYLAHQVTILSARLPSPPFPCPPSPATLPCSPRRHSVHNTWTYGWKTSPEQPPEPQEWTPM